MPCIAMQLWTALGRRVKRGRGVGCATVCARSQQRLLRAQASVCYVTLAKVTISREISDDVAHPAVQLGRCACGHMMVSACCCTSGDAWGPLCHRRCERCARLCRCSHLTVGAFSCASAMDCENKFEDLIKGAQGSRLCHKSELCWTLQSGAEETFDVNPYTTLKFRDPCWQPLTPCTLPPNMKQGGPSP